MVLLIGGNGYFGRLLAEDLKTYSSIQPIIAGRNGPVVADLRDKRTLEAALNGVRLVLCAAGPYQGMPTTLVELCLERGIPYIDIADDRDFSRRVRALVPKNDSKVPPICCGWSAVPALSALLARIAVGEQDSVRSIQIQIAPGNRNARNRATVESLLHSAGQNFDVFRDNKWRTVRGWSEPRAFDFPAPVGERTGYLVNVPDLDLFPEPFHASTVEFRVGSELRLLNGAISILAGLSRAGLVQQWAPLSGWIRNIAAVTGLFGNDWGAVGVEVQEAQRRRRVSVVADHDGPHLPVMPASIMAAEILAGRNVHGWVSPIDWLSPDRLEEECRRRGFRLVVEEVAEL